METSLVNLFGIALIAFLVPFVLGFAPKLRIPAIVLEIIAGIAVGPQMLNILRVDNGVQLMSTLGVAFLLFLAGMELDLEKLRGLPLQLGAVGFIVSIILALIGAFFMHEQGLVVSPALVAVALASTSVGIVIPVLKDTGNLDSLVGLFTVAGGSAGEFGGVILLGIFFSSNASTLGKELLSVLGQILALVLIAAVTYGVLWFLNRVMQWESAIAVAEKLDATSSQLQTRAALVLLFGGAVLASTFYFEAILGTFIAGIIFGSFIKGTKNEERNRVRLDAIGFGVFVPVFFIASGMKLSLSGITNVDVLEKIGFFLLVLLIARGLPALLYVRKIGLKNSIAAGLMQATNVSFIVVAVSVGLESNRIIPTTGTGLIMAGLLSAVLFPAAAQALLSKSRPSA